ncbi:MAG: uroporphyrinogen decarboxylase family protein [Anaerolineae bacterium]|jgi:uroporphyrinogen decarboxylase
MTAMTMHERMSRIYAHREPDRAPIVESPWASTVDRWRREGLPAGVDWEDYFGVDRYASIAVDNSPRYPERTLEVADAYRIYTTRWGVTQRDWRDHGGVPEFLHFTITDPDAWAAAKARMTPDPARVDWAHLERNYRRWRREGAWIRGHFWFGFDVTHSWMVGTERVLLALIERPEWVQDMVMTMLDLDIALFDMLYERGYSVDEINWPDDLGYKGNQFMSRRMYRELIKPAHHKACQWAHARGVKVCLHSCGDVRPLVPEFIDAGVDMLNPLEVKAGMDPLALKAQYGDALAFFGGLNAVLYETPELLWAEMRRVIPAMKRGGGYVIASDHSVPDNVSLDEFREFVRLAKELGRYE